MEDPEFELEWEIQEYHPSSKEGDNTKVRWMLNKGLDFGKNVVVTCIAISSAPLLLPPLVIMTAFGVAFSIPFGLVFASYACTEKLVTKLLPTPTPSSFMFEYYTDEDEEKEEVGDFLKREVLMEEEEKEQLEDTKLGVEMRIELDEGDTYNNYEAEPITYLEDNVDEDVGEHLEGEDSPLEGIGVKEEVDGQKLGREGSETKEQLAEMRRVVIMTTESEENNGNAREVEELDLVAREGDVGNEEKVTKHEEEEIVRGSTSLLQKFKDEGYEGDSEEEKVEEERDVAIPEENEKTIKEIENPFQGKDMKLEKFIRKREETASEENRMPETRNEEGNAAFEVKQVGQDEGTILGNENAKNANNIGDMNGITVNGKSIGENSDKIVEEQNRESEGGRAKDNTVADDVHEDTTILNRKKENVIHSNEDAREIADDNYLDLFDDRNAASDQNTCPVFESLEGNVKVKDITVPGSVGFLELPASIKVPESNYAKIAPETNSKMPSSEVFYKEEEIWEQIDAMRAIVGYKAAPQQTCIGEIKALYVFTGVEPPASLKDPSDLAVVNDKLRFLMSIVGVK